MRAAPGKTHGCESGDCRPRVRAPCCAPHETQFAGVQCFSSTNHPDYGPRAVRSELWRIRSEVGKHSEFISDTRNVGTHAINSNRPTLHLQVRIGGPCPYDQYAAAVITDPRFGSKHGRDEVVILSDDQRPLFRVAPCPMEQVRGERGIDHLLFPPRVAIPFSQRVGQVDSRVQMTPLRERREQRVAVVKTLRKANSRMSKSCELDRGRRSDYRAKSVRWFPSLVPAMVQTEGYTETRGGAVLHQRASDPPGGCFKCVFRLLYRSELARLRVVYLSVPVDECCNGDRPLHRLWHVIRSQERSRSPRQVKG